MGRPHLDIAVWLCNLELKEYCQIFKKYSGVEELLTLSEFDIKSLGVKNGAHRAKIVSSLVMLKEKMEKGRSKNRLIWNGTTNWNANALSLRDYADYSELDNSHYSPTNISIKSDRRRSDSQNSSTMENSVESPNVNDELKKALEWELSLDSSDLRSHGWYHGTIPRTRSEDLLGNDGDFLIRDCISRPGDYVLTCRCKSQPLHFIINKVILQPYTVYERIQYQFEDECFDTVPDLVTFYVGNKRPISAASGARILRPVNRNMPLSYYASRYNADCAAVIADKYSSPTNEGDRVDGTRNISRGIYPYLSGRIISNNNYPNNKHSSNGNSSQNGSNSSSGSGIIRVGSDPMLSPTMSHKSFDFRPHSSSISSDVMQRLGLMQENGQQPPPKPSRVPSMKTTQKPVISPKISRKPSIEYDEMAIEKGEADLLCSELEIENRDSVFQMTSNENCNGKVPKSSSLRRLGRLASGETRYSFLDHDSVDVEESVKPISVPDVKPKSVFDLGLSFTLLPGENKPLEGPILKKVKSLILEAGPKVIANHLTKVDLELLNIAGDTDFGLGISTGLELLTMPQGFQFRQDLLERIECLMLFVASTILTSTDVSEQSQLIYKWILVATEAKIALGNLFGFTGIMKGLDMPQIIQLKSAWLKLRQEHTDIAFTFETKLRPTIRAMQDTTNPQAPNTTFPYIISLLSVLENHSDLVEQEDLFSGCIQKKKGENVPSLGLPWETTASDYGLQLLLNHLENGRSMVQHCPFFKRNSEIVLNNVKFDNLLLEIFRTEFHLRFLWGSRAAAVAAKERYPKFRQVLTLMADRLEPS